MDKYDPQVLRFFMLSAHYRSPLNFSAELMESSKNGLERILTCADNLKYLADKAETQELSQDEVKLLHEVDSYIGRFDEAMDDDFNTADAISVIFDLVKFINSNVNDNSSKGFVNGLKAQFVILADILGLKVEREAELLDSDIEKLINERQEARKAKNFARADEIRQELLDKGIILEDTREGVKWKKA